MASLIELGWIFWIILATGVGAFGVFFERMLFLRRTQTDYLDFIKGVCNVLSNGNIEEATMLCEETRESPVAAVALTAIQHRAVKRDALRVAVDNAGLAEVSKMEGRIAAIAVICHIAPILGLAGTLVGVINIVGAIREHAPLVQSTDLTAGLQQALVTTLTGLLVAVFCHIMYTMLTVRIERVVLEMQAGASEIVAILTRENTNIL